MESSNYLGFSNLPDEVYRDALKRGLKFTLMVVGESGLGKSTLINSMFLPDICNSEEKPDSSRKNRQTLAIEAKTVLLEEFGIKLTLTVVDTPGFQNKVNNYNCWKPIADYIDLQYEQYFMDDEEILDDVVHCCLYFIAPNGHGLKPSDIYSMKILSKKVNLIPVIAKADTMTLRELYLFKIKIRNEIAQHKIKIYDFPTNLEDGVEDSISIQKLRSRIPFAVVGSNKIVEKPDGKQARGRCYPWGCVEVENTLHSDFIALRDLIIKTHLQNLKDVTFRVHYENYRRFRFSGSFLVNRPSRFFYRRPRRQINRKLWWNKRESKDEMAKKIRDLEIEEERHHKEFKMKLEKKKQELADAQFPELTPKMSYAQVLKLKCIPEI